MFWYCQSIHTSIHEDHIANKMQRGDSKCWTYLNVLIGISISLNCQRSHFLIALWYCEKLVVRTILVLPNWRKSFSLTFKKPNSALILQTWTVFTLKKKNKKNKKQTVSLTSKDVFLGGPLNVLPFQGLPGILKIEFGVEHY